LSKESGAMALAIWFVILASRRAGRAIWIRWRFLAALILAAYFTLRFTAWKTPPPPAAESTTLAQRPVLAARAVAEYCGLLAVPVTLRMERDVRDRPAVTSVVIGARDRAQLLGSLAAEEIVLPAEIRSALDDVSAGPAPAE